MNALPKNDCVVLLALWLAAMPAWAAEINDPTRPPLPAPRAPGPVVPAAEPDLVLQSVLLSHGGSYAIINGRLVALGGRIGDARVVQITEDEVVVESDGQWRTLKLYPGVRKGAVAGAARIVAPRREEPAGAARIVIPGRHAAPDKPRLIPVALRNRSAK